MADKERVFVIGYDICDEFTQISYFYSPMLEPESVRSTLNEKKFLFPTEKIEKDKIQLVDKKFLVKTLKMVPGYRTADEISGIMVSLKEYSKKQVDNIAEAFMEYGIPKERIRFQSYSESCIYYALSQKKEFIINDIVFFEFNSNSFFYRLLQIGREGKQTVAKLIEKDFSDVFSIDMLTDEDGRKTLDKSFLEIIQKEFERKNIGVVYIIGEGFYQEEWATESLKYLCNHRRVFKGSNLFTKGASYAAYDYYTNKVFEDYALICKWRIPWSVSLSVIHKEEPKEIIIAKAGSKWYEIESNLECILDDVLTLELLIGSVGTREKRVEEISLKELPYRANKMTRISINIVFTGEDKAVVKIKDLGFGDMALASEKTIKKEILL